MYWAIDKNNNFRFINYDSRYLTDKQLSTASYCYSECGTCTDSPFTIKTIRQEFKDCIKEEKNGGFEEGEFTQYKTVYDFIRNSWEIYSVLIPAKETNKALKYIKRVCKRNKWYNPTDYTVNDMQYELFKCYGGIYYAPDWIDSPTLNDILDTFWDVDIGMYQSLYD